jgi:hypothetical protein
MKATWNRLVIIVFLIGSAGSMLWSACSPSAKNDKEVLPTDKTSLSQRAVSNYLQQKLGANTEYTSIRFGILDTVYAPIDMDSANYFMERSQYYISQAEAALFKSSKLSQMYSDSSIYFSQLAVDYVDNFPKTPIGWQMEHSYRAAMRDTIIEQTSIFYLDTTFQVLSSIPKELTPQ